ncbi:MAG: DUF1003 domain-containing protein [Janthinobacterium lividum]
MTHRTRMAQQKQSTGAVDQNIRAVAGMQEDLETRRGLVDRLADTIGSFTGSMSFVAIHAAWFLLWFLINTGLIPGIPRFDPYPFILLAMIVSVEGVLLSTFVLMKQNRMQQRSDVRHQLDLQINLLAEKEVTKVLQLLRAVAAKMEIETDQDKELVEMAQITSVDLLSERVQRDLTADS